MFGRDWQPAQGRVVDRVVVSRNSQSSILVHDFIVDVELPGGGMLRARVEEPRIATDFWDPTIGQHVRVEVDVKRGKVRFDKSDPGISAKAQRRAREAEFEARLTQPAGTGGFPAVGGGPMAAGYPTGPSRAPAQVQALLAGLSNAQVVRLDPNDPTAQALRENLLAQFTRSV